MTKYLRLGEGGGTRRKQQTVESENCDIRGWQRAFSGIYCQAQLLEFLATQAALGMECQRSQGHVFFSALDSFFVHGHLVL